MLTLPAFVSAQSTATTKHSFDMGDWAALRSACAVAVSPEGTILYAINLGNDCGSTHREWWTVAADGSRAAKLNVSAEFSPMGFSRDGQSLYGGWRVNRRDQLAIFPLSGAQATDVPSTVIMLPRGIEAVRPSPDGKRFALLADPRLPDPLSEVRHVQEPDQISLYVVNMDGTGGQWWCSDLKNISEATWNPDSTSLAVLSAMPRIGHHDVRSAIDRCSSAGTKHIVDIANVASGIAWTDDGDKIAFLSTKSAVLTPEHLWTVAADGAVAEDRTPTLDGTALKLAGDAHGHVWVLVDHGVRNEVDEFRDGILKRVHLWPDGVVGSAPTSSDYSAGNDQLALTVSDPKHTWNVAVPKRDSLQKITNEGDLQLAAVDLGAVRVVDWKNDGKVPLEGIATFPAGYVAGRKYPFLVFPHGGPESNNKLQLDPLARIIAGLGYVVLQPEYRGSTGYGSDFLAAIYQHFGDRPYEDVESATDYAIAQGWADPARLAIFGWSAGGFITSWTITQTHRYKAAIEGAGITDWGPFLWTSDIQQIDYDARWTDEDPDAFRKFSAVAFAGRVTTPLLILHGEADQRVPPFQGIEFFQILAARDRKVRMVTYPESPHFPTSWTQLSNVVQEVTDWLKQYNQ
jgi:dipeptidyl aminopeptidase/acylaminoacyl peptidase